MTDLTITAGTPRATTSTLPAGLAVAIAAGAVLGAVSATWVATAGILVLWMIWYLLYEPGEGVVLPVAMTFQWLQVTIGLYYTRIFGRTIQWEQDVQTDAMVILGLACVTALTVGVRIGRGPPTRTPPSGPTIADQSPASVLTILLVYAVLVAAADAISQFAWSMGSLAQLFLSFTLVRFVFFYMLVAKIGRLRWAPLWITLLMACEVGVGITGYFARFRESFVIAFLALFGSIRVFRPRHLAALGLLAVMAVAVAWLWTGVKKAYRMDYAASATRHERMLRIRALSDTWLGNRQQSILESGDHLVDRIWSVEYQAHALKRVPTAVPHEDGRLILGALSHVFVPRAFFPDKSPPVHSSDLVRKYSGVWVAGEEDSVSIAFGYAAESYVDFGVPLMFVPIFVFGFLAGFAFRWLRGLLRDPLLRAAAVTTLFWVSLYLYERSWARLLGLSTTWLIGLGIIVFVLDRLWLSRDDVGGESA